MKLPILFAALIGVALLSISCKHAFITQTKSNSLYLGIPMDEEYPDSKFHLDGHVSKTRYWRVSKVQHVSRDEYERDIATGHTLFSAEHSGTQFYSTEMRVHLRDDTRTWYWVMVLERKAWP